VHVVKEDPSGADCSSRERSAVPSYRSTTATAGKRLQLNLPVTSVRDFEFYENDLIIATHGRGFWVIDDISPLRQLTPAVVASDAYLFKPVRFRVFAAGWR
jgi:hypothetical protein